MEEYKIYSSFLMVCDCKSFRNSLNINSYISVKLNINNYKTNYLFCCKEKPLEYDILLYDLYKDEYWVLDKNYIETSIQIKYTFSYIQYDDIVKYVIEYVEDNNKIFRLCFIEMKHFLLNKLNNTDIVIFKKLFINHFQESIEKKQILTKYFDNFITILEEINDEKIGNYFLQNHECVFDNILNEYCITHYHKELITDANYIITSINNLL